MRIEKIVLPTDFSEGSEVAVAYARDLAGRYGAELILVHVVYDVIEGTEWYGVQMAFGDVEKELQEVAANRLEELRKNQMADVARVKTVVRQGVSDREIVSLALEEHADLIVIGTHGRTGLDRVLFGSTAENVVRRAPCPVLSVRIPTHRGKK